MFRLNNYRNYSGVILVPPAVAGGEKGKEARTPRAPAGGRRPPAPLAEELQAEADAD